MNDIVRTIQEFALKATRAGDELSLEVATGDVLGLGGMSRRSTKRVEFLEFFVTPSKQKICQFDIFRLFKAYRFYCFSVTLNSRKLFTTLSSYG